MQTPESTVSPGSGMPATEANGARRDNQASLSLEQILDATASCLSESGYDGTTIRRIAARLSCAVGSIYRYCSDKRALLSQVAQRRFEPVVQAIDDVVPIEQTVLQYAQVAAVDPQQYRLMFWLGSLDADGHPGMLPPVVRRVIDGWARQLGDPRAAQRLWSQLHGLLTLGVAPEAIVAELNVADLRPGRADRRDPAAAAEYHQEAEAGAVGAATHGREDLTLL